MSVKQNLIRTKGRQHKLVLPPGSCANLTKLFSYCPVEMADVSEKRSVPSAQIVKLKTKVNGVLLVASSVAAEVWF